MPKARPLRSQASGASSAPSTSTAVNESELEEDVATEAEGDVSMSAEEKRPETEKTVTLEEPVSAEVPSSSATTLKTITNSEPSGLYPLISHVTTSCIVIF